jgi:hypothetical protein
MLLKVVTAVLLAKILEGIDVNEVQFWKMLLKVVTAVLLSKSPAGIDVNEEQFWKT